LGRFAGVNFGFVTGRCAKREFHSAWWNVPLFFKEGCPEGGGLNQRSIPNISYLHLTKMKRVTLIFLMCFTSAVAQNNQFAFLRIEVTDSTGQSLVPNVKIHLWKNDTTFVLTNNQTQIKLRKSLFDTITASHPKLGNTKLQINAKYGSLKEVKLLLPKSCSSIPVSNVCPKCKSNQDAIPIIYGPITKKQQKSADKGKLKLGGNEVSKCFPNNFCKKDNLEY
jgi:hypothetical protein